MIEIRLIELIESIENGKTLENSLALIAFRLFSIEFDCLSIEFDYNIC